MKLSPDFGIDSESIPYIDSSESEIDPGTVNKTTEPKKVTNDGHFRITVVDLNEQKTEKLKSNEEPFDIIYHAQSPFLESNGANVPSPLETTKSRKPRIVSNIQPPMFDTIDTIQPVFERNELILSPKAIATVGVNQKSKTDVRVDEKGLQLQILPKILIELDQSETLISDPIDTDDIFQPPVFETNALIQSPKAMATLGVTNKSKNDGDGPQLQIQHPMFCTIDTLEPQVFETNALIHSPKVMTSVTNKSKSDIRVRRGKVSKLRIQPPMFDNIDVIQPSVFETIALSRSPSARTTLLAKSESRKPQSEQEGLVRHGRYKKGSGSLPFNQEVRLIRISIGIVCLYLVLSFS